jgi:hypothetical protein
VPVLTADPGDVANPRCHRRAVASALQSDPARLGPRGSDLLRYAWASAALDAHPELHAAWAGTEDRAVRRALMRSPQLTPEAAELLVETRRSGMHTLGANPAAPVELLERNPGALGRRTRLDRVLTDGLRTVTRDPRAALVELGSGTVDLVLARADALTDATARLLASRRQPPVDPWVLAVLVDRFGDGVWRAASGHASRSRLTATAALSSRAASLLAR